MTKINIQHGKLLEPIFQFYHKESDDPGLVKGGWNSWVPPTEDKIIERIIKFKEIWSKYEENIISIICSSLGLRFNGDIDVYVVSGLSRSMSNPLIIGSQHSPDNFVVQLAHELVHRILSSNKEQYKINNEFLMLRGDSDAVNSHIIVYSMLRKVFEGDEEMMKLVEPTKNEAYKKAYELSASYEEILNYFRGKIERPNP